MNHNYNPNMARFGNQNGKRYEMDDDELWDAAQEVIQQMIAACVYPSAENYDRYKPDHLPGRSALLYRFDATWTEIRDGVRKIRPKKVITSTGKTCDCGQPATQIVNVQFCNPQGFLCSLLVPYCDACARQYQEDEEWMQRHGYRLAEPQI